MAKGPFLDVIRQSLKSEKNDDEAGCGIEVERDSEACSSAFGSFLYSLNCNCPCLSISARL